MSTASSTQVFRLPIMVIWWNESPVLLTRILDLVSDARVNATTLINFVSVANAGEAKVAARNLMKGFEARRSVERGLVHSHCAHNYVLMWDPSPLKRQSSVSRT